MSFFNKKGPSGFSSASTAQDVTEGINGTGLTAIVTGASSGIGAETARVLSLRGVHVVMAVRNLITGANVKDTIIKENPHAKVDIMELDLSSFASVKKFAAEFNTKDLPLNILINNAGTFGTPYMLSQDNIEMQFATNHLGHFLLTNLLLETMIRTSQQQNIEGRIVNVSSVGHRFPYSEGIRFEKINDEQGYSPSAAYAQSKLANILHANELAKRLKEDGVDITANSLHPGIIVNTEIWRHRSIFNGFVNLIGKYFLKNIQQGAATTCYVALNPQVKGISGKYFADCNTGNPSALSQDTELAKKLWEFSINLVN